MDEENIKLTFEQLVDFLRQAEHFKEADPQLLKEVVAAAHWQVVPSREVLMRQGEKESRVFLVVSGKIHYEKRNADGEITAGGEFKSGEMVGEISFLRDHRAVATVYAIRNCHLMSLDQAFFESFLLRCPAVLVSISRKVIHIADRSLSALPQLAPCASLALLPLNTSVRLSDFSAKLAEALRAYGRVACISRARLESELGGARADLGIRDPKFAENLSWLARCAADHDFLILEADAADTPWSRMCEQEADRIFLVGPGDGDAQLTALEKKLAQLQSDFSPKSELVLLHAPNARPARTPEFLRERSVTRHHHIFGDEGYGRLARGLTGNTIGLALGGGGVRAATQIGLLRAFKEAGIPIDHIGGTSIGALVGAFHAVGYTPAEMENIIHERIVRDNLFNDYVAPFVSLVRGKKFTRFLSDVLGDRHIEDLATDYFSVATNLTTGGIEVRDRGLTWLAVRASASLPAILPPLVENGNVYVDGGILDNIPGEVLRRRGAGKVIAIDVSSAQRTDGDTRLGELIKSPGTAPSFLQIVRNKFARPRQRYSSLGDIIVRSMVVGSRESAQKIKDNADVYVRMPVNDWGMLDFKATPELVRIGYEHTQKHIAEWKQTLGL